METIRIGLLGASRISRDAIIAPAAEIERVSVSSVAARDAARASAFAREHGIANVEPDYAALVHSDRVDLVYNALPASEHARWSIAALQAGKHVLCEKPFALNAAEAQQMVAAAAAGGRLLIEAFHYRFHPLFERVLELVRNGEIGAVTGIDARFCVPIACTPGELRYAPALGGGAFMDLGCYPAHWARTVMQEEPVVTGAQAQWHKSGVDVAMDAQLEFGGDVTASLCCSMAPALPDRLDARLVVAGDRGSLTVNNPLVPHVGHQLVLQTAGGSSTETVAGGTTYFHQLQHVVSALSEQAPQVTGGTDAIGNMRLLDEVYRLARRTQVQACGLPIDC